MPNIISLDFKTLDIYSLAMHINKVPLMNEVVVRNESEYNFKNLELEITSSPSFFAPFITKIPSISTGRHISIDANDIDIDVTKIMYTTSPISSVIMLKIKNMGEVLAESSKTVTVLPYDFIPKVSDYTELIASFVTPDEEAVGIIAESVVECIKADNSIPVNRDMWNYSEKITGKTIIKAIYDAVKKLKITFNTSNILSENKPVRIKLAESVFSSRQGTSFDIALLMASVSEYFNINSFIAITQDKTLVGFFYLDECFDTCVLDDGRAFSDLVDGCNDRFCLVDTTSVINGTDVGLESSLITAQKAVDSSDLSIIIDVTRSRKCGYQPLPNRVFQNGNLIFDISCTGKQNKTNKSGFYEIKSQRDLSAYIKKELLQGADFNLVNVLPDKSIFLVGGVRYIVSKLFFNGKILLKGLPFTNVINSSEDTFDQLQKLNINLGVQDMSPSVNVFHEKEMLNSRVKLIISQKNNFSSSCISFGLVQCLFNGNQITSPLFFAPASFEISESDGIFVTVSSTDITLNNSLVNFLTRSGINTEFFGNSDNLFDNYIELTNALQDEFAEHHGFQFFDIVSLSSSEINSQALADIASAEHLSQSDILNRIFQGNEFDIKLPPECISLSDIDMPFVLDSSQAAAVYSALNNECSVIKGANGSGKTQVATSVAFSELRKGRKVLYISDSNSGVRSFLDFAEQAGFKNYVMHLKDEGKIANDFDMSSYSLSESDDDELTNVIENITGLTNIHDSYYKDIHSVNEIGFSLYEAASQYERYRSFPYSVNFTNGEISKLTRNDTVHWFDTVAALAKAGADCNEPYSNPLSYIKKKEFSYELKSSSVIKLTSHISLTQDFINTQSQIVTLLGAELTIMKEKQSEVICEMMNCLMNEGKYIHHGIFNRQSIESDFAQIEALTLQCDDIFELRTFVKSNFTDDIIGIDCDFLLSEWRNANSKFAFTRASALSSLRNKLKVYSIDAKYITNDNFVSAINKISRYKREISLIEDNAQLIQQVCGIDILSAISSGTEEVFSTIKNSINASQRYLTFITQLYDSEQVPAEFYSHQSNLFKSKDAFLANVEKFSPEFISIYESYKASENELVDLLEIDIKSAKEENSKIWYYFLVQFLSRLKDNIDILKYWCNWNIEKEKAISVGLGNVIELYESEQLTSNDIKNAFLKGFFKSVTEYFLSCKNSVAEFSSSHLSSISSEIYSLSGNYRSIIKKNIRNVISDNFHTFVENMRISESEADTILKKNFAYEINSKADKQSVLLLQNAKPCFISSSALFLSKFNELPKFDTVIIDCAETKNQSSLFLLFPITQKVVILDSTGKTTNSDLLSEWLIRNNCIVSELGWLYNTNYSTQVANELFYDSCLSSFLFASRKKYALNVIQQQGTYDRKSTRVNVIEASTVVDEIVKLKAENPSASIGVYAMTEEQRALIEMLLKKRVGAQEFNKYFSSDEKESLFIRSFKMSAFDVRNTIILSTVFSDDEKSKYKYSISKTIPELAGSTSAMKLINILTSAKKSFTLVTSLTKETLDNFKTTEKNYVFFKKTILKLLDTNNTLSQNLNGATNAENPIIREVANHIEALGYKAEFDIGINKCKIDIAVRNKEKNAYLLGIIFDESIYNSSGNFFGRDLIMNGLQHFGNWKILRIFTVDWFENHTKQLDIITTALNGNSIENELTVN